MAAVSGEGEALARRIEAAIYGDAEGVDQDEREVVAAAVMDEVAEVTAAIRAEAGETIATLRDAYREAIGVPESEHQRRRMEALATALEAALAENAALRAAHIHPTEETP